MLEKIDLNKSIPKKEFKSTFPRFRNQHYRLQKAFWDAGLSVIILFEGWDAGGRGVAIKRVTEKLDPRGYVFHSIATPQGENAARHYMYRFWRRLKLGGGRQQIVCPYQGA